MVVVVRAGGSGCRSWVSVVALGVEALRVETGLRSLSDEAKGFRGYW